MSLWEAVGKMPSSLPPSTAATINDATIGAVSSIPPPLPLMTTAIATIDGCHCRCHTVISNDRQKPAVVVCCQRWQWRSLLMEAAVDGSRSNGGFGQWQSSVMEAAVGRRINDAMVLAAMMSSANGGSGNGSSHCQLCSGG